jgi:hypothetical protein
MTVWDELKLTLVRLREERPGALAASPDPRGDNGGTPPYEIQLAPWAEAEAGELSRQFGDAVNLTVGALPYPPGRPPSRLSAGPGHVADLLDPREAETELDGPALVRSGHTLRHGLLVRSRSGAELAIATNGHVTAEVVDPDSGEVVGGFSGWQSPPLIMFRVAPGATERIPLLIGTASTTARLGYAVPSGTWGVQATQDLAPDCGERIRRRTPVLPLTITA